MMSKIFKELFGLAGIGFDSGCYFIIIGAIIESIGVYIGYTRYWLWNPVIVITGFMMVFMGASTAILFILIHAYQYNKQYQMQLGSEIQ